MCGSSQSYNIPAAPSYGEGLADALEAQVDLLKGTGDFADTGALIDLLPLEEAVRKKTAQTDTDVLRQTLLGSRESSEVSGTYDDQGRLVIGETPNFTETPGSAGISVQQKQNGNIDISFLDRGQNKVLTTLRNIEPAELGITDYNNYTIGTQVIRKFQQGLAGEYQNTLDRANEAIAPTRVEGEPTPIYGRDESGKIITDITKVGETDTVTISEKQKEGLVDILGDKRGVVDYETRKATQADVDDGLAEEVGDTITDEVQTGRQAGFDETGEFLGASALADEITAANLSRQRERDLTDVERLQDRYDQVIEQARPGTSAGLDAAQTAITNEGLRINPAMAAPIIGSPTGTTYGGDVKGSTMTAATVGKTPTLNAQTSFTAATVANPLALQADTQFGGDAGIGQIAGGEDSLRSMLLSDARGSLDEQLTARERRRISEAFKGQSAMMGRTFDQRAGIAEAEALVEEDNARKMQNRAFAQSALGQEAGLQEGDLTRGMAQEGEQARLNQAKQLADAQMLQQQRAMGLEAGMLQDSQQAELDQSRILAQAELDQQKGAFDAQASQQANLANQAQQQIANQFGVGATMDAERLNEQLKQQRLANYIGSVGALASLENQYSSDPFRDLLGRGGADSLTAGQNVVGQANYGLTSQPSYLNPEGGLGYISNMAANNASVAAAQAAAQGSTRGGFFQGLGAGIGGFCWVAREVYGVRNPAWLRFRMWMFAESPKWFFELYLKYGQRVAMWISDKPRIKALVRKWMDSKIRGL